MSGEPTERGCLRHDRDRPLARHDAKVPEIEGQDLTAISLGAGDHRRIGKSKREIVIPLYQLVDPR
ncbi:MAG: hypothetical protein QOF01_2805 [Thermomicrobiales bacterium]|nr:hypothetical protein [Thermomicrobiales bacterium]